MLPPVFPFITFLQTQFRITVFDAVSTKSMAVHPWLILQSHVLLQRATQNGADAKPHCHALRGKHLFVGGMLV